ncbi:MAG: 2-hydroxyglutaryl-CoA dehydratase [Syntrophomonadaceae bacterium]|nr:2-hydroxyglutaryl-CoA dehydratase [Syntrophomonadaceae bacterium]
MVKAYLGVDVGSVSTNLVALDSEFKVLETIYLRTMGNPVKASQEGYQMLISRLPGLKVMGVGATGSGRNLVAAMLGVDEVKNEITAHAVGATHFFPGVQTVMEIGGQDSKLIMLRDGVVIDFAMNTVCAAGTGSFLDQQSLRLNIPIEEFGGYALRAGQPVRIAGRCGVFAESDMIHKQQMGYPTEDIIAGLCEALARNYLNNLGKGKEIKPPVVFQGGVAANKGLLQAFEKMLQLEILVPDYYDVMGAVGVALLAAEAVQGRKTTFRGNKFILEGDFQSNSIECTGCPNACEVVSIQRHGQVLAYFGDRCRRWDASLRSGNGGLPEERKDDNWGQGSTPLWEEQISHDSQTAAGQDV